MSIFGIFIILLVFTYIIYYGYNISKDIYGRKDKKEDDEEIYDVSDMVIEPLKKDNEEDSQQINQDERNATNYEKEENFLELSSIINKVEKTTNKNLNLYQYAEAIKYNTLLGLAKKNPEKFEVYKKIQTSTKKYIRI